MYTLGAYIVPLPHISWLARYWIQLDADDWAGENSPRFFGGEFLSSAKGEVFEVVDSTWTTAGWDSMVIFRCLSLMNGGIPVAHLVTKIFDDSFWAGQGLWNELDTEQLGIVRLIDLDEAWQNDVQSAFWAEPPSIILRYSFYFCIATKVFSFFRSSVLGPLWSPLYTGLEETSAFIIVIHSCIFKAAGAGCTLDWHAIFVPTGQSTTCW